MPEPKPNGCNRLLKIGCFILCLPCILALLVTLYQQAVPGGPGAHCGDVFYDGSTHFVESRKCRDGLDCRSSGDFESWGTIKKMPHSCQ